MPSAIIVSNIWIVDLAGQQFDRASLVDLPVVLYVAWRATSPAPGLSPEPRTPCHEPRLPRSRRRFVPRSDCTPGSWRDGAAYSGDLRGCRSVEHLLRRRARIDRYLPWQLRRLPNRKNRWPRPHQPLGPLCRIDTSAVRIRGSVLPAAGAEDYRPRQVHRRSPTGQRHPRGHLRDGLAALSRLQRDRGRGVGDDLVARRRSRRRPRRRDLQRHRPLLLDRVRRRGAPCHRLHRSSSPPSRSRTCEARAGLGGGGAPSHGARFASF
jgi:hypothetical protein